jgi:hypothetical protein
MNEKLILATKHILEDNLNINRLPFSEQPVVIVYDDECELTKII